MQITTATEAEQFDQGLAAYEIAHAGSALPYFPLRLAFEKFNPTTGDGRRFYSLLDLKINVVLLSNDMWTVGRMWNEAFTTAAERQRNALDDPAVFLAKMSFHEALNSFVLRYRAVWDKVFSFMVLDLAPEAYTSFRNQKKGRRRAFLRAVGDHPSLSKPRLEAVLHDLERFESIFRTPEIHDTGSIRTWSFTITEFSGSPHELLVGFWNNLVSTLSSISQNIERR